GENRLTAEASSHLLDLAGGGANLRYGLYRGKAAVGADFLLGNRMGLYSTLYDPNNPSVDLEGLFDIGSTYALWAGVDELNRHARPVVGIRLKP
ncbi:MAG: hypothetical protein LC772_02590, partial [Chloroflexi bacterium]|nr:hypothetical protein [Chloroflexota bacterium]